MERAGLKKVTRKRCYVCYKNMKQNISSDYASRYARRISTYCDLCDVPMCYQCFDNEHGGARLPSNSGLNNVLVAIPLN
nr:unnamed protein product [Callosobruchus chinensis]